MYPPQVTVVKLDEPVELSSSESSLSKSLSKSQISVREPSVSLDRCADDACCESQQAAHGEAGRKRNRSNPPSQGDRKHHQSNQSHQSNHQPNSSNDSQTNLNPFQRKFKPRPNRRNYHYSNYDRGYDRGFDRGFDRHYDRHYDRQYDYQPNYPNRSKFEHKPFDYKLAHHQDTRYGKPHYGEQPFRPEFVKLERLDLGALDENTLELVRNKQRLNKKLDERFEKELEMQQRQQLKEIQYYEKIKQIDQQANCAQLANNENDMNRLNEPVGQPYEQPPHRHQFKSQHSVDAHQLIRASVEHRSLEVHQKRDSLSNSLSNSPSNSLSNGRLCSVSPPHYYGRPANLLPVNESPNALNRSTDPPMTTDRSLDRSHSSPNCRSLNCSANGTPFNGIPFNGSSLNGNSFHSKPFHRPNKSLDRTASDSPGHALDRSLKYAQTIKPTVTSRPITKCNNPTAHPTLHTEQLLINGFYACASDLVPKISNGPHSKALPMQGGEPAGCQIAASTQANSPVTGRNQANGNHLAGYALANGQLLSHMQLLANPQAINLLNYPANAIVHLNHSLETKLNVSLNVSNGGQKLLLQSAVEQNNNLNGNAGKPNGSTNKPAGSSKPSDCPVHDQTAKKSKAANQKPNAAAFEPADSEQQTKKASDVPIRDKADEQPPPNQSCAGSQSNHANGRVDGQPTSAGSLTIQATSSAQQTAAKPGKSEKFNGKCADQEPEKCNGRKANTRDYSKEREYVKLDYGKEKRPYGNLNEFKQRKNGKLNKHPNAGPPRTASTNYTSYGPSYPKLIQNDVLSSQIWKTYLLLRQTPESYQRKIELRQILYDVLRQQFENNLYIVGSSLNGLGTNTSDVDMCLLLPDRVGEIDQISQAIPLLELVKKVIQSRPELGFFDTDNMKLIHAKIPILKFSDKRSKIEVDLNINNIVGIRNTQLIRCYTRLDWRVQPLAIAIKAWAHRNNIKNAYQKTISSYTLVLMLIHYLQVGCSPPCLPCLHKLMPNNFHTDSDVKKLSLNEETPEYRSKNEQSLGELFVGFLDYYGNRFNYLQDVISIRQGAVMKKEVAKEYRSAKNTSTQWRFICCEEPFDRTNTARSVSDYDSYMRIIGVFKESYARLKATQSLLSVLNLDHILNQTYRTADQHSFNGITSEMISSSSSSDLTQQANSSQNSSQGSDHTTVGPNGHRVAA